MPKTTNITQGYMINMYNAWNKGIPPSIFKNELSEDMLIINSIGNALIDIKTRQKAMNDLKNSLKNKYR